VSLARGLRTLDQRVVLGALIVLAAVLRLPNLAQRGQWDADQGHDALTLLRFTQGGVVPLLGPPTSIGNFHHGAFYYYLLAPVAAISGTNPVALESAIALMGIAAVAVTWWLARAIAGPLAGLIAGLLLAVSPAGISESTFLWNPNPIPLFAAVSLAAAWHAHRTGRARWWVLAIACAGVVFQLHVLGVVFIPPVIALLVADVRAARRGGNGSEASRLVQAGVAGVVVIALLFVPLLIHELQNDWSETRNAIAYFTAGGSSGGDLGLLGSLLFTLLRVVGWPLVGLVTDVPLAAVLALAVVLALGLWVAIGRRTDPETRLAIRWLLLTIAWATIALAILAPSLQTVVSGLPNDHYHAFIDPIVVTIVGVAAALLITPSEPRRSPARLVRAGVGALLVLALATIGVARMPAWTDPNGGWAAAEAAGRRIVGTTSMYPVILVSVPDFKPPDAIGFPVAKAGGSILALSGSGPGAGYVVVVCDRLFQSVVGEPCGGPAEDLRVADALGGSLAMTPTLVDRFDVSPRTSVSVYKP
jgi:hypothetical protein